MLRSSRVRRVFSSPEPDPTGSRQTRRYAHEAGDRRAWTGDRLSWLCLVHAIFTVRQDDDVSMQSASTPVLAMANELERGDRGQGFSPSVAG